MNVVSPIDELIRSLGGKKHRQHHVWQHYLDAWSVDDRIWASRNGGVPFNTDTVNVAVERDFYKLHELTQNDLQLLRLLTSGPKHPSAKAVDAGLITGLLAPIHLVQQHRRLFGTPEQVDEFIDVYRTNILENYHDRLETAFLPILRKIRHGDLTCLTYTNECITFFHFMLTQYMRTKGIREKIIQKVLSENGQDLRRIWPILSLIFGRDIGATLFAERDKRTLAFVENRTGVPFITGDQPVINLHGQSPEPTETVSLYYPVTPRSALMVTEVGEQPPFLTGSLAPEDVALLNERIARAAHSQVFAATKEDLRNSEIA